MQTQTIVDMKSRIVEAARRLIQSRGYCGFSYADVAIAVGIRKASIHHHFPTKEDLGLEVVRDFRRGCEVALDAVDRDHAEPLDRLRAYAETFVATLADDGRMCLCGMLSADADTLPGSVRNELAAAIDQEEEWLTRVIENGVQAGRLAPGETSASRARAFFSGLEGALLLARVNRDVDRLRAVAESFLRTFAVD